MSECIVSRYLDIFIILFWRFCCILFLRPQVTRLKNSSCCHVQFYTWLLQVLWTNNLCSGQDFFTFYYFMNIIISYHIFLLYEYRYFLQFFFQEFYDRFMGEEIKDICIFQLNRLPNFLSKKVFKRVIFCNKINVGKNPSTLHLGKSYQHTPFEMNSETEGTHLEWMHPEQKEAEFLLNAAPFGFLKESHNGKIDMNVYFKSSEYGQKLSV